MSLWFKQKKSNHLTATDSKKLVYIIVILDNLRLIIDLVIMIDSSSRLSINMLKTLKSFKAFSKVIRNQNFNITGVN
jgi:hypothetical protein